MVCAAPVVGVTVAGLKLQLAPAGKPEQVKLTAWLNPFAGVMLTNVVTELPADAEPFVGERPMVKSTGSGWMVMSNTGDVDAARMLFPLYTAVIACVSMARELVA